VHQMMKLDKKRKYREAMKLLNRAEFLLKEAYRAHIAKTTA